MSNPLPRVTGEVNTNHGPMDSCPYAEAHRLEDCTLATRCPKCGQYDHGQTGEYPCDECGLPRLHDGSPELN